MRLFRSKKDKLEQDLTSLRIEPLNTHELKNAETRVWNQLSQSIQKLNKKNKNMEQNEIPSRKGLLQGWNLQKYAVLTISLVLIATTLGIGGFLSYRRSVKNSASADINSLDVASLAAARFKELNGVSYDELNTLSAGAEKAASSFQNSPATDSAGSRNLTMQVDNDKAKQIAQNIDKDKIKVFYSDQEITFYAQNGNVTNYLPGLGISSSGATENLQNHPRVNLSKSLNSKSWYSPIYSKHILKQGNELISYNDRTPEYSIQYMGGDYAIKSIYENSLELSAYLGEANSNIELTFLKELLSNKDYFEKLGLEKIDGKDLAVFQTKEITYDKPARTISAEDLTVKEDSKLVTSSSSRTKFFINLDKFQLYMVENYEEGKIVQRVKNLNTKEITLKEYLNENQSHELNGVDIKEYKMASLYPVNTNKFTDLVNKHKVYYLSSLASLLSNPYDSGFNDQREAYENAFNSKSFNPLINSTTAINKYSVNLISYSQDKLYYYTYKDDPSQLYKHPGSKTSKVSINVDGTKISADLIEQSSKSPDINLKQENIDMPVRDTVSLNSYTLIFRLPDGQWYVITEYYGNGDSVLKKENLSFKRLTRAEAENIDQEQENKTKAWPEVSSTSIDKIASEQRLLPGDLSKDFELTASNIGKSERQSTTCDKYSETLNNQCLVEKFNGFMINFTKEYKPGSGSGSTSPASPEGIREIAPVMSTSLDFLVLNAKLTDVKPLLDKVNNPKASSLRAGTMSYSTREINGRTIVIFSSLSTEDQNTILKRVDIDNGYASLKEQLSKLNKVQTMDQPASKGAY